MKTNKDYKSDNLILLFRIGTSINQDSFIHNDNGEKVIDKELSTEIFTWLAENDIISEVNNYSPEKDFLTKLK